MIGEIWVELNECCTGEPSGAPLPEELPDSFFDAEIEADNLVVRESGPTGVVFPETYEEGLLMVMMSRDLILEQFSQSGKTIFVVGHAGAGATLIGLLQGYDMLKEMPERPVYLQNTGIHMLVQDPDTGEFTVEEEIINDPPRE